MYALGHSLKLISYCNTYVYTVVPLCFVVKILFWLLDFTKIKSYKIYNSPSDIIDLADINAISITHNQDMAIAFFI